MKKEIIEMIEKLQQEFKGLKSISDDEIKYYRDWAFNHPAKNQNEKGKENNGK